MSDLGALRAHYKELAGKNPSPALKADALQAKIAELQAAAAAAAPPAAAPPQDPPQDPPAAAPPQDPPAAGPPQDPPAADPPADPAPAADPAAAPQGEGEDEQSVEEACAELGLSIEKDGHCPVEMLEGVSGGLNLRRGDPHRFEAAEAARAVRAGIAKPRG